MGKRNVLVIDDDQDFLRLTQLQLEKTGNYEVRTLATAESALSEVHSFRPDVVLLDMMMPSTGGVEVCKMLYDDSQGKDIPVVILSGLSKDKDKYNAYKEGVINYLVKPVETEDLLVAIENAIRLAEAHRKK